MLEPHKARGGLVASAPSIEIVCGWASWSNDRKGCRVENFDELGLGGISWYLTPGGDTCSGRAIAWVPVDEMAYPDWIKQ